MIQAKIAKGLDFHVLPSPVFQASVRGGDAIAIGVLGRLS